MGIFPLPFGAVAQLGERRTGSAEVWGSIPHSSTKDCLFMMLARRAHAKEAPGKKSASVKAGLLLCLMPVAEAASESSVGPIQQQLLDAYAAIELPRTYCLFQHIIEALARWTGRTRTIAD